MSEYDNIKTYPQSITPTTSFTGAIDLITKGIIMRRQSWPDDETVIALHNDVLSIFKPDTRAWHPLLVSLGDMQGEDWVIYPTPTKLNL